MSLLRLNLDQLAVDTFEPTPLTPFPTEDGDTKPAGCSEISCGYTECNTRCKLCHDEAEPIRL